MPNKILFITKNYPPKIGGLENYSFNIIQTFGNNVETYRITLSKSSLHLIWFLPYAFFISFFIIFKKKITHVHLCDASLSPIGLILKKSCGVKVSTTAAGLDITFHNKIYQKIIPFCVNRLDKIIAISNATRIECHSRGIDNDKISVIPVGINAAAFPDPNSTSLNIKNLETILNRPLREKIIISTVGRLVKRKGVYWFLENVVPLLDDRYLYVVAGNGPERERIETLLSQLHHPAEVLLLGEISDETKFLLLKNSHFFIMPNISIPGDVEGFGIVALEAGLFGTPVVAPNIQGIKDAVIDGVTGTLVEEKDTGEFIQSLLNFSFDRDKVRSSVINNFDWQKIYYRYAKEIFNS